MPQGLAALMRAKYPGAYDDMSDADLESAVIAKYPEYQDLATKSVPPKSFEERTQARLAKTFTQQDKQAKNVEKLTRDPASMASMVASVIAPERKLLQAGLQGVAGTGAGLYKGESFGEALTHGAEAAGIPAAMEGLQRGATWLAPKLKQYGLDLGKSVFKVRDPVAKMATASGGGTNLDAGVNEVIQTLADEGLLAPTAKNRTKAFGLKEKAGQAVEKAWRTTPDRPLGITREDRLLPSHATSTEDVLLGEPPVPGSTMTVSPQQFRGSGGGDIRNAIRFQEGTPGGPNPARGGFPGDQVESVQYLGEGGLQDIPSQELGGPGVLRREVPPRVVPGQPFDTVARKDILGIIDDEILKAEGSAAPTTGLRALRDRWVAMPDYVDRATARDVVKGINMRLGPRYHNAINDPVAVAAEKEVGRQVRGPMMTPEIEAANARYAQLKPAALAVSHAAKRAGARDIIGLKGAIHAYGGAQAGGAAGGPLGALAGGLGGLGFAVASHPIPQGHAAQTLYDIGKSLPASVRARLTPEAMRAAILALLAQQQKQ